MKHSTEDIEHRMEAHGVKPTAMRIMILRTLDAAERPLSGLELEQLLVTADRSTITRTLSLFSEKHLIHLIEDGSGSARYESCPSHEHHSVSDLHAHFHCSACGRTFCLPSTAIPAVALPEGFSATTANFVITGLCPDCR